MLLSLIVVKSWNRLNFIVHVHGEVIIDDEVAPNLHNLNEEGLSVALLTNLLESLSEVKV